MTLFLALLIRSSVFYRSGGYWTRQARMIGALLVALFVGETYSIQAMANCAYTFTVLYALEKSTDVVHALSHQINVVVLVLLCSIAMVRDAANLDRTPTLGVVAVHGRLVSRHASVARCRVLRAVASARLDRLLTVDANNKFKCTGIRFVVCVCAHARVAARVGRRCVADGRASSDLLRRRR